MTMFALSPQSDLLPMELPLTRSAAGSPAKISAPPEGALGLPASAVGFGLKSPVWLANWHPDTSSWKTSQHCLVEGLETFSETWPRSGMMRSGTAYQLPTLVPVTDATESGLWPTPRRQSANGAGLHGQGGMDLQTAVLFWPTPSASDNRDRGNLSSPAVKRRFLIGKQLMLSQVVSEISGALNPTWVEWLMGFPTEHTDLRPSETP